jgi:hypothetical protein
MATFYNLTDSPSILDVLEELAADNGVYVWALNEAVALGNAYFDAG